MEFSIMRCRINNDEWHDVGKIYFVHSLKSQPNSTGVTLNLEDEDGNMSERVIASHQIDWIEE
jgi:cation diffusion facilitator CzcD-associated flavoprotein CzcO